MADSIKIHSRTYGESFAFLYLYKHQFQVSDPGPEGPLFCAMAAVSSVDTLNLIKILLKILDKCSHAPLR